MDNLADLINVGIAEMIKERCELPAFSTLDRLARRIRTMVNHQFFHVVLNRLTSDDKNTLDQLLMIPEDNHHSPYNDLKDVPKGPTKTHFQDLQTRLSWLSTLGNVERLLEGIPPAKVKPNARHRLSRCRFHDTRIPAGGKSRPHRHVAKAFRARRRIYSVHARGICFGGTSRLQ